MPEFMLGVLAAFVIGSTGFWILAAIALWIILACIDDGDAGIISIVFFIWVGVTLLAHDAQPVGWLRVNWLYVTVGFVAYCGAGIGWTLFKFNRFVSKLARTGNQRHYAEPSKNKSRIIGWLLYWPFSIAHDIGADLGNFLYDSISGRLDAIVERHFPKGK